MYLPGTQMTRVLIMITKDLLFLRVQPPKQKTNWLQVFMHIVHEYLQGGPPTSYKWSYNPYK